MPVVVVEVVGSFSKTSTMQSVASCQTSRCQGDGHKQTWAAAHELQRGHARLLPFRSGTQANESEQLEFAICISRSA